MSHCIVPDWSTRKQRQEEIEGEDKRNINTISSQVQQFPQNLSNYIVPMSINYEVGDLAWDNYKQPIIPLHGHGGIQLPPKTKPTWSSTRTGDTLESLVHQATSSNNTTQSRRGGDLGPTSSAGKWRENVVAPNLGSMTASSGRENMVEQNDGTTYSGFKISPMGDYSGGKRVENWSSGLVISKRIKSESEKYSGNKCFQVEERGSSGVGASATLCKENTMMTWASFESAPPTNVDDESACQDFSDQELGNKEESVRSQSSSRRNTLAAVVHNQSERRRRDRINEKMKALQKLVPNANKTDKASMLDEVIEYLKQLQAQVQMLSNARAMPPQLLMSLGMQQQLQMSLLGMGMGMGPAGIVGVNNSPQNMAQPFTPLLHGATPLRTAPSFMISPPFTLVPPLTHLKANIDAADINRSMPNHFNDSYSTFLAQQSMDFYNRMASLYRHQTIQPSKKPDRLSRQNNAQGE